MYPVIDRLTWSNKCLLVLAVKYFSATNRNDRFSHISFLGIKETVLPLIGYHFCSLLIKLGSLRECASVGFLVPSRGAKDVFRQSSTISLKTSGLLYLAIHFIVQVTNLRTLPDVQYKKKIRHERKHVQKTSVNHTFTKANMLLTATLIGINVVSQDSFPFIAEYHPADEILSGLGHTRYSTEASDRSGTRSLLQSMVNDIRKNRSWREAR